MDIDRLEKPSRIEYTFVEDSIALDSLAELLDGNPLTQPFQKLATANGGLFLYLLIM